MKAWITSLEDYNNGILTGEWVDLDDTLWDSIETFLETRRKATGGLHEEYAVHDYDDVPRNLVDWLGEYPSKEQIEILGELEERELMPWAAWLAIDVQADDVQEFRDHFSGETDDLANWAEDLVSDICDLKSVPDLVRYAIDWDRVAHDLTMSDYSDIEIDGTHYLFHV